MIAPIAIDNYFARKWNDSSHAKRIPRAVLEERIRNLPVQMEFHTKPRKHQLVTFLLCIQYDSYFITLDPGLGKSKIVLDLLEYRRRLGTVQRMLVLVPNTTNITSWQDEVKVHTPHLSSVALLGGVEGRESALESEAPVVISTYASLLHSVCTPKPKEARVKNKNALEIDLEKLISFAQRFQMIVPDESQNLINHNSLVYKVVKALRKRIYHCYPMTGTAFGKDPTDMWAQYHLVDYGDTLGPTLGFFRQAYCTAKKDHWSGFDDYKFDKAKRPQFERIIRHHAIAYEQTECVDLPAVTEVTRKVIFPKETWAYYDKLTQELQQAHGNFRAIDNAYHRMRMMCSGFLPVKDPEDMNHVIKFKDNPKLEAVMEWISEINPQRKIVLFHEYVMTGNIIAERLKKDKIKHTTLAGATRDKGGNLRKFLDDPDCRILVVNSKSGGAGLNLQVANYMGFVETPSAPIVRKQCFHRINRLGQKLPTVVADFIVTASIETRIVDSVKKGVDFYETVIRAGRVEAPAPLMMPRNAQPLRQRAPAQGVLFK